MTTNARPAHTLILSEDDHYAEMEAIHDGTASELHRCPIDDSLQGIAFTRIFKGSPLGFDGGDVITLNCGHVVI